MRREVLSGIIDLDEAQFDNLLFIFWTKPPGKDICEGEKAVKKQ